MRKLGCFPTIIIGIVVLLALWIISGIFLPTPTPTVELSANYGGAATVPDPFFTLGPIYVTNTLLATWVTIVVLGLLFYFATRKMSLVPKGMQNLMEAIVEWLLNLIEGIAGKKDGRRFFPVVASIFLFVAFNAWLSLLPVFNVIGQSHQGTSNTFFAQLLNNTSYQYTGTIIDVPYLRGANTDINVPLMLALASFFCVEYWGFSALGLSYLGKFFRLGGIKHGLGQLIRGRIGPALGAIFMGVIDAFVGGLELISEFMRLISFTFRLFGNMTAGEILLAVIAFVAAWAVPVIFYGLEFFIGFVQAIIFGGLTLIFATFAVAHESEEEH